MVLFLGKKLSPRSHPDGGLSRARHQVGPGRAACRNTVWKGHRPGSFTDYFLKNFPKNLPSGAARRAARSGGSWTGRPTGAKPDADLPPPCIFRHCPLHGLPLAPSPISPIPQWYGNENFESFKKRHFMVISGIF